MYYFHRKHNHNYYEVFKYNFDVINSIKYVLTIVLDNLLCFLFWSDIIIDTNYCLCKFAFYVNSVYLYESVMI